MTKSNSRIGVAYDRQLFNRRILIWAHCVLASMAGLAYLTTINFSRFGYWRRGAGVGVIAIASVAMFPYLISGFYAVKHASGRQFYLWVYLILLSICTVLVIIFYILIFPQTQGSFAMYFVTFLELMTFSSLSYYCFGSRKEH